MVCHIYKKIYKHVYLYIYLYNSQNLKSYYAFTRLGKEFFIWGSCEGDNVNNRAYNRVGNPKFNKKICENSHSVLCSSLTLETKKHLRKADALTQDLKKIRSIMNEYLANSDVYSEREEKLQLARFSSRGKPSEHAKELVIKVWEIRRKLNTELGNQIENILRSLNGEQ